VVDGEGEVAQRALPVRVGVERVLLAARHRNAVRPRAEFAERRRVGDLHGDADALDQRVDVLGVRQVVRPDVGVVQWVAAAQAQSAGALGAQQQWQDGPRLRAHQWLVHGVVDDVAQTQYLADVLAAVRVDRAGCKVELHVREVFAMVCVPANAIKIRNHAKKVRL